MNRLRLLFFATLRDQAGTRSVELDVPEGTTVEALKQLLAQQFPALKASLVTAVTAVNREYSREDAVLPENAEVAFFPPVSGG